jgi:carbon-monoxide dehydrogenase large subunit
VGKFGVGQAYRRTEDQRFLTGTGRYTDDIHPDNVAYLHLLRSPYAHGEISELDTSAAAESPGVLAVYTIEDLDAAGIKPLPIGVTAPTAPGTQAADCPRPVLARGQVKYVGEPMVAIVAETQAQAEDAAELISFDIQDLPPVASLDVALQAGAPQVWPQAEKNIYSRMLLGNPDATETAFRQAAHVVSIDLVNNRLAPTPLEVRGCVAEYDAETDRYVLHQGCQGVHVLRAWAAAALGVDASKIRVLCPDVGGGFGMRFYLQHEPVCALHAARELGRPVKWIATRSEGFVSDPHGRDHRLHAELALDEEARFLGLRAQVFANIGAYHGQTGTFVPHSGYEMACGAYNIPAAHIDLFGVVTNTAPVDAYRGAGRPEALYMTERLVDKAARQLGVSAAEIRARNFATDFPHQTPLGPCYDSGDYRRLLDSCVARADVRGFEERRQKSAQRGMLRGLGVCYYVEICAGPSSEKPELTILENGLVRVVVGTQASGQGHETTYAQMVAEELGVPVEDVQIIQGDTDSLAWGSGTGGSRTMSIGGSALTLTVAAAIEQGRQLAADELEASGSDIEFDAGAFTVVGTDRQVDLATVVQRSYTAQQLPDGVTPGLSASVSFEPEAGNFPNGCHICEVEIDPDTGSVAILRYTAEDDVGTVINPLILEGQIIGGIAQGLGQALMEHAVYDAETGQLVTGSFVDYTMPRADTIPGVDFQSNPVPSPRNPLGCKGAGEAGTIGSTPAVANAIIDALAPAGVTAIDMPMTAHAIWQALQKTRAA